MTELQHFPEKTFANVFALEAMCGADWSAIRAAHDHASQQLAVLRSGLAAYHDPNCSILVTGSLGRLEANSQSDADWMLLADSPSDPSHSRVVHDINKVVSDAGFKSVGPTNTFGTLVVSHELVHHIAGTRDTNENLTRRILLLAESTALTNAQVRERVIGNILQRYIVDDRAAAGARRDRGLVPHFLVNDVVRYWRTMASDYASKMWERRREGWATRNIKLRFSRKLLYVWGLLATFSPSLFPTADLESKENDSERAQLVLEHIRENTNVPPLDMLARVAMHPDVAPATRGDLFGSYDAFLLALANEETRKHLDKLPFEQATADERYCSLRDHGRVFGKALLDLFFDQHPGLQRLVREYGVF